jgi:ubiquitin C-terminal hydrolase
MEIDLSLHLPEPNVSLSYCIRSYSNKEYMKGQDKFFCDKCNSK